MIHGRQMQNERFVAGKMNCVQVRARCHFKLCKMRSHKSPEPKLDYFTISGPEFGSGFGFSALGFGPGAGLGGKRLSESEILGVMPAP